MIENAEKAMIKEAKKNNTLREKSKVERLPSRTDPALKLTLVLYSGSTSTHRYRARLSTEGVRGIYVEHYCDSQRAAKEWALTEGETILLSKVGPKCPTGALVQDLRLKTAYALLRDTSDCADLRDYFDDIPPALWDALDMPLSQLTAENCKEAVVAAYDREDERKHAIAQLTSLLGACHLRGMLRTPLVLRYSNSRYDKYSKALRAALTQWVIPEHMCRRIYNLCLTRMADNPYYLAVALMLTMGLTVAEVCGLRWRDIDELGGADHGTGPWVAPGGGPWMLRIRRFYKRIGSAGTTKCAIVAAENAYKYRLIAIPPAARALLGRYIELYGQDVRGSDPLIAARRGDASMTPDALRHFAKMLLRDHGIEELARKIPIRDRDTLKDTYMILEPDLGVFSRSWEYHMRRHGMPEYMVARYLGHQPVSTLDKHYWESKSRSALLRQYAYCARWDLRTQDGGAMPPEAKQWHGAEVTDSIPAPPGYVSDTRVTIRAERGCAVEMEASAGLGYTCQIVVTQSEPGGAAVAG